MIARNEVKKFSPKLKCSSLKFQAVVYKNKGQVTAQVTMQYKQSEPMR